MRKKIGEGGLSKHISLKAKMREVLGHRSHGNILRGTGLAGPHEKRDKNNCDSRKVGGKQEWGTEWQGGAGTHRQKIQKREKKLKRKQLWQFIRTSNKKASATWGGGAQKRPERQ